MLSPTTKESDLGLGQRFKDEVDLTRIEA